MISNKLLKTYQFNDYELEDIKAVQIAKLIIEIKPHINEKQIENFFDKVNKGVYGVLYKMPTCILSMFQKFILEPENIVPEFKLGGDGNR